jgi:hypothetical protein
MRATEIIRSILDLIDDIESHQLAPDRAQHKSSRINQDVESMVRYEQIQDLLPDLSDMLAPLQNSPSPKIADISAVTTQTGTDLNKSKHPSDIRGEHASMYHHAQWDGR